MTAKIASAYISNNHVASADLPALLAQVHGALAGLLDRPADAPTGPEKATPAQIRKSITPDHLISFEDGKPYKTLRRHLTLRGLTPEGYRAKWGLPADYPMTSAGYSQQRSELALALGLGQKRRKVAKEAAEAREAAAKVPPAVELVPEPKKARRARKVAEAV